MYILFTSILINKNLRCLFVCKFNFEKFPVTKKFFWKGMHSKMSLNAPIVMLFFYSLFSVLIPFVRFSNTNFTFEVHELTEEVTILVMKLL